MLWYSELSIIAESPSNNPMSADQSKIITAFTSLNESIKVPKEKLAIVDSRLNRIIAALDTYYYGSAQKKVKFLIGSIGRQTDIRTSDVDVIYKVPAHLFSRYDTYTSNGQKQMLQDFRSAILGTYPKTYVKADGLVAIVEFADDVVFELMPGMENNDYSFKYPITSNGGSWGMTNPLPEIAAMDEIQRETGRNARKLARMVRAWKEHNGVTMGGLLIDTYVYRFLKNYDGRARSYVYYDYMSRDFFKYLSETSDATSYIYALGSNQRVYIYGKFSAAAAVAYKNALSAIEAFNDELYWTSSSHWKSIFGAKFPSF